jgi:hypothetical protein
MGLRSPRIYHEQEGEVNVNRIDENPFLDGVFFY